MFYGDVVSGFDKLQAWSAVGLVEIGDAVVEVCVEGPESVLNIGPVTPALEF